MIRICRKCGREAKGSWGCNQCPDFSWRDTAIVADPLVGPLQTRLDLYRVLIRQVLWHPGWWHPGWSRPWRGEEAYELRGFDTNKPRSEWDS